MKKRKNEYRDERVLYTFGKNIDILLGLNKCINYEEKGRFLRYDRNRLSYLLAGKQNIKLSTAVKMAEILDIDFPDLFIPDIMKNKWTNFSGATYIDYRNMFVRNVRRIVENDETKNFNSINESSLTHTNKVLNNKVDNPTLVTLFLISQDVDRPLWELFRRIDNADTNSI
jgi:transcriptional regulator with XRE-family HTH domain